MKLRGGGAIHSELFYHIINFQNLLEAWKEFSRGKTKKKDIQLFGFHLEHNLLILERQLMNQTYMPDPYEGFYVHDPKRRHIHKATVRDRVVHQAIYRILSEIFEKTFIYDSYACRLKKGTHFGVRRIESFVRKVTKNYKGKGYYLKCDVSKFFDSIDHDILFGMIKEKMNDQKVLWLIDLLLKSFEKKKGIGLPLGNVTSQLFGNIYLTKFDHFMKFNLKEKYYGRYCDDFIVLSYQEEHLKKLVLTIKDFLADDLCLELHPRKVTLKKISQGIDFLGYIILPYRLYLRTSTKKRMMRRVKENPKIEVIQSYLGLLSHAKTHKLSEFVKELIIR